MDDPMYDTICKMVRTSYENACVLFVDMVRNERLEHEHEKLKTKYSTVLQLFHGTPESNIRSIAENGFKCEKNVRSVYGKGTYFSQYASYSKEYATTSKADQVTYMFVCDVIKELTNGGTIEGIYVTPHDYAGIPKYLVAFYKNTK